MKKVGHKSMKPMMCKVIFIFAILLLQGCVGVNTIVSESRHAELPTLGFHKGEIDWVAIPDSSPRYSRDDVIKLWGKPNKEHQEDNQDQLIYHRELKFSGAVIWVVVPIPLTVPTGHRSTLLTFENGILSEVTYEYSRTPFIGGGFVGSWHYSWGRFSDSFH